MNGQNWTLIFLKEFCVTSSVTGDPHCVTLFPWHEDPSLSSSAVAKVGIPQTDREIWFWEFSLFQINPLSGLIQLISHPHLYKSSRQNMWDFLRLSFLCLKSLQHFMGYPLHPQPSALLGSTLSWHCCVWEDLVWPWHNQIHSNPNLNPFQAQVEW